MLYLKMKKLVILLYHFFVFLKFDNNTEYNHVNVRVTGLLGTFVIKIKSFL